MPGAVSTHAGKFVCGKDNAFRLAKRRDSSAPARWRISYALDRAEILRSVLLKQPEKLNTAYWRATHRLRLKLFKQDSKKPMPDRTGFKKVD